MLLKNSNPTKLQLFKNSQTFIRLKKCEWLRKALLQPSLQLCKPQGGLWLPYGWSAGPVALQRRSQLQRAMQTLSSWLSSGVPPFSPLTRGGGVMNPLNLFACLTCICVTPCLLKGVSHLRETLQETPSLVFAPSFYVYDVHISQASPSFQVYSV